MSKRKKFWITFASVVTCIIAVLVIFSLVFRVKTVDVEIRVRAEQSQSKLPDGVQDEVLKYGNFEYGKHIMFYNTSKSVAEIERRISYVKVEQVIKHFPNVIRVYISERTMKYRVQDTLNTNKWYILDEDFKVLETVTAEEASNQSGEYYQKTIEIAAGTLKISANVGEFVNQNQIKSRLNAIAKGVYGRTKDSGKAAKISFGEENGQFVATVLMKTKNVQIKIFGDDALQDKTFNGVSLLYNDATSMVEKEDIAVGQVINVFKNTDGKIVAQIAND